MSSKNYEIGQVLYIVSHQKQRIIPVQIVEINRKSSLNGGEETSYMISTPYSDKIHNMSEDKNVYEDLSEVSNLLKSNACKAIDEMVENVHAIALQKFEMPKQKKIQSNKSESVDLDDELFESNPYEVIRKDVQEAQQNIISSPSRPQKRTRNKKKKEMATKDSSQNDKASGEISSASNEIAAEERRRKIMNVAQPAVAKSVRLPDGQVVPISS